MWKLDYKESWALKNSCFWTVVLEKTLESPLDCKEIQPVHPQENQSWRTDWKSFIGRTDAEAETPILWPPDTKNWLNGKDPNSGKDWSQEENGMTEDEMVGCHYRHNTHEFEQALGIGDGQGSLAMLQSIGSQRARHYWATELNTSHMNISVWCWGRRNPQYLYGECVCVCTRIHLCSVVSNSLRPRL